MNEIYFLLASLKLLVPQFRYQHFNQLCELCDAGQSLEQSIESLHLSPLTDFCKANPEWWKQVLLKQKKYSELGIKFCCPKSPDYPGDFLTLEVPPILLSYLGEPCWQNKVSLSVVGSRRPHQQTLKWMDEHLSEFLFRHDCNVISGGARGVDQKAHALAITHGRPTLVFVPSGLGALYPQELYQWQKSVLDGGGAFMSEYGYATEVKNYHFRERNRMIAALGLMTLIVECGQRSGTRLTAQYAVEQAKPLLVLPGHPMDANYRGSIDLIAEGASMIRDASDLKLYFESELISQVKLVHMDNLKAVSTRFSDAKKLDTCIAEK